MSPETRCLLLDLEHGKYVDDIEGALKFLIEERDRLQEEVDNLYEGRFDDWL